MIPFKLNRGQKYILDRRNQQLQKTGRVRLLIVKSRQIGCSTLIEGLFYHKAVFSKKILKAFILTHTERATNSVFDMVYNFHQHQVPLQLSDGILNRPDLLNASSKELKFKEYGSSYEVGTAGSRDIGRGMTINLFHGSEVGFWGDNADTLITGAMQAVGDVPGTEIILESTANGEGNLFHRMVEASIRGESDYEVVFLPWHWHDDYQVLAKDIPDEWQPSLEWLDYAKEYNLSWEQLYWAYKKNRELGNSIGEKPSKVCWKFRQEYPASMAEAFQTSGDTFIPAEAVRKARNPETQILPTGPLVIGVDPARSGDKVGVIDRQGRRLGMRVCERLDPGGSLVHVSTLIAKIIDQHRPQMVCIDVGGNGAAVYDNLLDWGYGESTMLEPVNFGSRPYGKGPTGDRLYLNRRAEMYDEMREWFCGEVAVQMADNAGLQSDLTSIQWGAQATRYDSSNRLILEDKDKIKARLGSSPDLADAAALTFSVPMSSGGTVNSYASPPRKVRNQRTGY